MKKTDVPQHSGLLAGNREVNYAVDGDGRYGLEPSVGWDAKNIALRQAWEEIRQQLRQVIADIEAGKQSTLAYHMVKNQMDVILLSQYSGVARWRVKRHLKPKNFVKLDSTALAPYVELFGLTVDQLRRVPQEADLLLNDSAHNDPGEDKSENS